MLALAITLLVVVGVATGISVVVDHEAAAAEIFGLVALVALVTAAAVRPRVRAHTIVDLDLPAIPAELADRNPLTRLRGGGTLTLADTVTTLHRVARDPRVWGIIVKPRFGPAPMASIEELTEALGVVRAAGKRVVAVSDTFGEGGPANGSYVMAAACDEIVVHPAGLVGLVPLAVEPNFYRTLLDRLGVTLEVGARHEYKDFLNQLVEHGFTAPQYEATHRLLESIWEQVVGAVARGRRLEPSTVRAIADRGPLVADDALAAGLVDRVAYTDEAIAAAKTSAGEGAKVLGFATYRKRAGKGRRKGKAVPVAVVMAVGEIHRSGGAPIGLGGGPILSADDLSTTLRAVAKHKKVKAVVLRVDSPGGSAIASDTMWRELIRVKEAGKPLVVSMGGVAASGGYYLAAAADRVVAQRTTITGSIGVITAHVVLADAKAKLGIEPGQIHTGAEPTAFTVNRPLTPAQQERADAQLDRVYELFVRRVAEGRGLPAEDVHLVAKGRVWTGADAATNGLVDDLGGMERAVTVALELSGAPAGSRADVRLFPKRAGVLAGVRKKSGEGTDDLAAHLPLLGPVASLVRLLTGDPGGVLTHLGHDPREFWIR